MKKVKIKIIDRHGKKGCSRGILLERNLLQRGELQGLVL